jgi:hypothetical protein
MVPLPPPRRPCCPTRPAVCAQCAGARGGGAGGAATLLQAGFTLGANFGPGIPDGSLSLADAGESAPPQTRTPSAVRDAGAAPAGVAKREKLIVKQKR